MPRGPRSTITTATKLDENNSDKVTGISHTIVAKRRKRTYDAAMKIHAIPKSTKPEATCVAGNGMWNTLVTNVKTKVVARVLRKSKIVCENVVPQIVNDSVSGFEKSSKNFIRSASVLYREGILSKRKYCSVRSSEIFDWDIPSKRRKCTEFAESCKVPALIPYKELMKFIDTQDIGNLRDIPQATAEGLKEMLAKNWRIRQMKLDGVVCLLLCLSPLDPRWLTFACQVR